MASYWYSTDGMDHKRLSNRHLAVLDRAFERRMRVDIRDKSAFGDLPAVADPYLGTMTSGDIHYGLYRNPSLRTSEMDALDNLVLVDSSLDLNTNTSRSRHGNTNNSYSNLTNAMGALPQCDGDDRVLVASDRNVSESARPTTPSFARPRRHIMQSNAAEEECYCCIIS
ncbi:hypothetical protein BCR43DRAFT_499898 [Syncephalastrum racemosum]|uniref:Uncharacterized protein n=1 Tax=Syncephalastrum racemosum TaxID=13706 RepID=A0A1X2GZS4_SYNRA|nr:hypothetical protein BCR43DRAFT_499898 [Syncephalastrum racemosum]